MYITVTNDKQKCHCWKTNSLLLQMILSWIFNYLQKIIYILYNAWYSHLKQHSVEFFFFFFFKGNMILSLGEEKTLNVTFAYTLENLYWQIKQENQYLHWKVSPLHKYFHKNLWIILRSWKFVSQLSWKVHIKMVS